MYHDQYNPSENVNENNTRTMINQNSQLCKIYMDKKKQKLTKMIKMNLQMIVSFPTSHTKQEVNQGFISPPLSNLIGQL